jgi:hypothetical protein
VLRLKPGASLILACNHYAYASQPLLLAAWGERWRMQEANPDEVEAKLAKILQGADPPFSEEAVTMHLTEGSFDAPISSSPASSGALGSRDAAEAGCLRVKREPSCCPAGRPLVRPGPCARAWAQRGSPLAHPPHRHSRR